MDRPGTTGGVPAGGLGDREAHLSRLASERFDAVVVGGGITGAGIALDLAARGLSVALVERGDFASGTSSRSSKLIHGGLRYLAQYQFDVTRESLVERGILLRTAPGLVHTLPFVIPVYDCPVEAARIAVGLALYDALAGRHNRRPFGHLRRHDLRDVAPGLRVDGLTAAFVYDDCRTDDARLTLAVLAQAVARGAAVANHCGGESLVMEGGQARGVRVRDRLAGRELVVRAKQVVLATGAWADRELPLSGRAPLPVRPSKGVHLFLPRERLPVHAALYLPSGVDGRLIFVVPWHGRVLVGTTDTDYDGDVARPAVETADADYLLGILNRSFPEHRFSRDDVVGAQAGLRPLVRESGSSARASRGEHVWERSDGAVQIAGGKLTTYRRMAERVGAIVARRLGAAPDSRTEQIALAPAGESPRAACIRRLAEQESALGAPIVARQSPLRAEVVYAARYEQARRIGDVLARRTRLLLLDHAGAVAAAPDVAGLMGRELGWDETKRTSALGHFADESAQYRPPA